MKIGKYFGLFLLLMLTQRLLAQTKKAYIKSNGGYTSNPKNAVGYVLVQKLNDSAYTVKQYDMRDTIVMQGIYKDEGLKIQNGKFVYYKKEPLSAFKQDSQFNIDEYIPIDTNNYVEGVAYYNNGKKTGNWITFWARNKRLTENTYDDGKLSGPFKVYEKTSDYWTEGTMLDGITVDSTVFYNPDSLMVGVTHFKNGKAISGEFILKDAAPDYNFDHYMETKLNPYKDVLAFASPEVAITVDKSGKITDAKILVGNSPEIDKAIIDALLHAPLFTPAVYKGVIVEDKMSESFMLFRSNK